MSIDFATLQGLTIPEGVVTQITDASGRVLWSAEKVAVGSWYLRPSSDISTEHCFIRDGSAVAYPDGYSISGENKEGERPVFVFINEEVSDEDAAYLQASLFQGVRYSHFNISGNLPSRMKSIVTSVIGVSGYIYLEDASSTDGKSPPSASASIIVCIDNEEVEIPVPFTNSNERTFELFEVESSALTLAINTFMENNGNGFPSLTMKVKTDTFKDTTTKDAAIINISQVYLKLTGNYIA